MIIDNIDIWRIAIGDSLTQCKDTWTSRGFPVNHFEAITPDTMPTNELIFTEKHNRKYTKTHAPFSDVEKAIFYSHYALWKKCHTTNRPITVIEHDTKLIGNFPVLWDVRRLKYFCVGHRALRNDGLYDTKYSPAAGYVLTPLGAEVLLKNTTGKNICWNVDHYIRIYRDPNSPSWAIRYAEQYERDYDRASIHLK